MLKITYSESSLHLERSAQTIAAFLSQRTQLSWQMQYAFTLEKSYGAFLLSAHLPHLAQLIAASQQIAPREISFSTGDEEMVEVSLQGYWIAEHPHSAEGVLVAELPTRLEILLVRFWQASQTQAVAKSTQWP
ncbi:alr0857 family protein [Almyronema epifaneia]|uniref:Alr0857 family protein n=1 Tax=Almyronema epifaneia S1 TaxID=2991925 RepID=A0ABW6IB13_9CYAN